VTTQFVNHLAAELASADATFNTYKYHGFGIVSTTPPAITDTGLESEVTDNVGGNPDRGTGTQVASTNTYTSVGTVVFNTTRSVVEHGLFNKLYGVAGEKLMDRHTFTAIAVEAGDSIQSTYVLTCTAGG